MGDSIKFGPEWLRNMSNDTGGLSSAATSSTGGGGTNNFAYPNNQTRYPLAEYRYGREEMLSLHDKNFKLPELLPKFNKLFIEKMQSPLALLPPTADDDTPRGLTPIGGISSERSGLGQANSSSGSALSGISNAIGNIGMSARGIRGSSIDRGRGRARGGLYHSSLGNYQSRSGFAYDEDARGAGQRADRSWAERNGNSTAEAEWSTATNSPSPRKDFSQVRSGPDGSWRRNRVDEDGQIPNGTNEGWRTSSSVNTNTSYKWPVRSTSWRGGDGEPNSSFNSDGGPPRLERSKSTQGGVGSREMDGTGGPGMRRFGMNANASWDEDNYPEWAMDEPIEGGGSFDATGAFLGNVDKTTGEKIKYQSSDGLQSDKHQSQSTKCDDKSESINSNGANENDNSMAGISNINNSIEDESKLKPNDESLIESSATQKNSKSGGRDNKSSNIYETEKERKPNEEPTPPNTSMPDSNYIDNAIIASNKQKSLTTDRMLEVAEDIEKLIMDDDQSCAESDDQLLPEHVPKHPHVDDAMATSDNKSKEKDLSDLWYYRDPQGKIQGPFTATEMLEWYRAGYFDETLNVRRVCDPQFLELGELLKACSAPGAIPFISMPIIPSLLQNNAKADISLSANAKIHPASPTKPLANLVHNQQQQQQQQQQQKILAPQPTPPSNTPGYYDMLQSQSFMNLMNAPPNDFLLSNSLPKHPSQNLANLPNALSKQAHLKNQQQTQSLQHLLSQHKKDFNAAPDGGATANNVPIIHQDPVIRMLSSMNLPHQQNSANVMPVPTMPQPTTPQNNSFQSLMMQLHTMQKPHVLQQQIQQHHQQSIIMNAMNSSTLPRNHNTLGARNPIDEINQQQPQMPHQTDAHRAAAHGLWDLPIPSQLQSNTNPKLPTMHNNIVPSSSMKTELQIIEHLHAKVKQQDVSRLQYPQFAGINNQSQLNHLHPQNEMQSQHPSSQHPAAQQAQQQQQQQQQQPPPQVGPSSMVLGNLPSDLLLQQSDIFRTKNDNIKDIQLDANKQQQLQQQSGVGKAAKNKTEPVTAATLKQIDPKQFQANNNKINNNLIEPTIDEPQQQTDKIDNNNKLNKAKNVNVAAAASASTTNKSIEPKSQSKANNNAANDEANKKSTNNNNNANANATAPKTTTKESTKKKKEQKAAEEKRRQQEEEDRQQLEERKRLELIAAQRKAKLVDQNPARIEPTPKRNNLAASVAPWSNITENQSSNASTTPLTLTEIQKAERERRAELYRLEQAQQQNQALLDQQQHKESVLKWKLNPQNQAKSLTEIQAEESKARQQTTLLIAANQAQQNKQNAKKDDGKWPVSTWSMIWGNEQTGNNSNLTNPNASLQSGNGNANCFWEDPSKSSSIVQSKSVTQQNGTTSKPLARSQTVSSMQSVSNESKAKQAAPLTTSGSAVAVNTSNLTKSNAAAAGNAASSNNSSNKKAKDTTAKPKKKANNSEEANNDEFGTWCNNKLAAHVNVIDVPTFVSFLRDIESPFEVKDYIRMYLGETKECSEFAKNFLERRSKYKNQQRAANAHIDDMCSPAPAITPANESQESKGKGKKEKKKNKMTKLDSRILGFSVTSAEDRLNVGARDYARDGP